MDFSNMSNGLVCGALLALNDAKCFNTRNLSDIIMRDLVKVYNQKKNLSARQLEVARMKLPLYEARLADLEYSPVKLTTPDSQNSDYRIALHNPTTLRIYMPKNSPMENIVKKIGIIDQTHEYFLVQATKRNVYVMLHNGFMIEPRVKTRIMERNDSLPELSFDSLLLTPKDYQKEGICFIESRNGKMLLADDMGLGKTGQAISWTFLTNKEKICIVCPASLKANWAKEITLWTGDTDIALLSGKSPTACMLQSLKNTKWLIINYDIIQSWQPVLSKLKLQCYIFDEAHALKNKSTQKTKACLALAKKAPHILALSGTPIENRPIEFWNLLCMIDPILFSSKVSFENRFCGVEHVTKNIGGQLVTFTDKKGSSNTKDLHKILSDTFMIRRKKKDVLKELPDKQRTVIPVTLSQQARKEYLKVQYDFLEWLKNTYPGLEKKAKKAQALVQIGYLKRLAAKNKMPMVFDWIDNYLEVEDKLVVFAYHKDVIQMLEEKYKSCCVVIDGSVAVTKRQPLVDAFQTDPKIKIFIGNIRAAGTGLTLTAAKDTLTVEFDWTSTKHDQAEDRVHRIGQKNAVTAYYIIAQDTIDERIASILDEKRSIVTGIMDGEDVEDSALFNILLDVYNKEV